jgi:putative FmdB family regulatory protein
MLVMPKYEYSCIECDLDYEKERSIHDAEPEYFCEKCGYALQRVYTPFGLQFKGSGFYKTGG